MLFTKSIFELVSQGDGLRVSVMSRHTLNDGVTPDLRIEGKYDLHLREVAPPDKIVGDHYKRGLPWSDFREAYLAHLRGANVARYVRDLAEMAMSRDITLLCVEALGENCHRKLLAEECQMYQPKLVVIHR